eukprot:TRINITY_DN7221_c0_g1_i4.p1 TRINITY_DN7221_c0_g1~~TRINITY_DN7221_c0_g1_i4.p1  ORF type:complete len:779 (+),score=327.16 TRINITY_DN7221_c0_g1_i4:98-2338(+)
MMAFRSGCGRYVVRRPALLRALQARLAHVQAGGVQVDEQLKQLVEQEIIPGTGVAPDAFWAGLASIVSELGPRNRAMLDKRDEIQKKIDAWHIERKGKPQDMAEYKAFLESIGYLVKPGAPFEVETAHVDPEIAQIPGPQLVCPVDNARFIVNAANARWGSLLDALYGTDAVPGDRSGPYNNERGAKVFAEAQRYMDEIFPLAGAKWDDVTSLSVEDGALRVEAGGKTTTLQKPEQFAGFLPGVPTARSVLLRNNGLHFEIQIDRDHPIGKTHKAGFKDIQVESALSTIADAEDSACTVDAADKCVAYGNWAGLMKGTIQVPMQKGGKQIMRAQNPDRSWTTADGKGTITLPGRAVLLCRNVGIHMYTDAVKTAAGEEVPEQFLDIMVTALAAIHDLKGKSKVRNSKTGSIYIVKPKMHGPEECKLVMDLFAKAEQILGLPADTIKVGIMDEERRTTVNLREMMREAKRRVVFVNTGFLDRTGDEIHTSWEAGPMMPKAECKAAPWLAAYEDNNVDAGIETKFVGHGQIGKGMWAAPDNMAQMLKEKIGHCKAGATTAWVPSPTGATLHALHYHQCDVRAVQAGMKGHRDTLDRILTYPVMPADRKLTPEEIKRELENNLQGLLGYVVRWVGQGIGCSKVPDINHVQLMEDRATLRISSQHVANWLYHGIVTKEQVIEEMKRMAQVVDKQNAGDKNYRPMAPGYDSIEWQAALDLIFKGRETPNGYTEWTLGSRRRELKAAMASKA